MRLPTVNKFQDRWKDIVKNVKLGMTQQRSAEAEGVAVQTLYRWIKRAKQAADGDDEYVKFYAELRRANALCEKRAAKHLRNAAEFDWKAALALLERRFLAIGVNG